MPTSKKILEEMNAYLRRCLEFTDRGQRNRYAIREYLKKSTLDYALSYIKLGCEFIKGAVNWQDLRSRWGGVFDAFQGSELTTGWLFSNKDFKKAAAAKMIKLLKKSAGIPTGRDKDIFNTLLKEIRIEPTKIMVTGTKGWILKRKVSKEVPKTKEEILLELEAKVASS